MSAAINLNAILLFWATNEDVNDDSQNIYYDKGRGKFRQQQLLLFSPKVLQIPTFIQIKLGYSDTPTCPSWVAILQCKSPL